MTSTSPPTIEAVFLDVGGVFVVPDPAVVGPVVASTGRLDRVPNAGELLRGHYAGVAEMDARSWADPAASRAEGAAIWSGYHEGMARAMGVAPDLIEGTVIALGEVFTWTTDLWRWIIPGSIDALGRLAATGIPLVIVSNSDGTVESVLRDRSVCQVGEGAGHVIVGVVDSHVVGCAKPDPAIFGFALGLLGGDGLDGQGVHGRRVADPSRVVHVGDTGHADVDGAIAAGVRPLHLDPHGDCARPDHHEHVRTLDDVTALLASR